MAIKTRILVVSDTHGRVFDVKEAHKADVVIHCEKASGRTWSPNRRRSSLGPLGEPRRLIDQAKGAGIVFLDEVNYEFTLQNGACLRVYASPWTPAAFLGRAFQYPEDEGHEFAIADAAQAVMTHGPPGGIFDYTDWNTRAGCPLLFGAVARARPLIHCFGHIHEAWGCKLVKWKDDTSSRRRSPRLHQFSNIDTEKSVVIEKLPNLLRGEDDDAESAKAKTEKIERYSRQGFCSTSHCHDDANTLVPGSHTLFVNASYDGSDSGPAGVLDSQWP
ncbi:hypothetical protein PG994_014118 [Apiospora phragmitis]|uniref:Calcineurin-like phosphoesterase domain-containing protein n=1 Tax=Apiospora phragmitis TaxID=2905665 RepID=A0ABR1T3F5_9PEZI